jgi:hypothetical protein
MNIKEGIKKTSIGLLKSAWALVFRSAFFCIFTVSARHGADELTATAILAAGFVLINVLLPRLAERAPNPILRYMLRPTIFPEQFRRRFRARLSLEIDSAFAVIGDAIREERPYPKYNPATGFRMMSNGRDFYGNKYGYGRAPGKRF